jgi:integrase
MSTQAWPDASDWSGLDPRFTLEEEEIPWERRSANAPWHETIEEYLRDQQHAGRINSPESMRAYRRVLRLHAEDTPVGSLRSTREDVKRTLARWGHPNTRAMGHSILTSFYDWTLVEAYRPDNPARQVRTSKMRKPAAYRLTRAEVDAMIAACQGIRERRLILLGVCTGARASELAGFRGRHFDRPGFVWFSPDIAKGKRERWVPVLPELTPIVEDIRATVAPDEVVIRACNNSGVGLRPARCQISHSALAHLLNRVAQRAGIARHIHLHLLRHAFGDHIARHAGLRAAQAMMGHASVNTTASVYVDRPGLEELAESVQGLHYGAQSHAATEAPPETADLMAELRQLIERARAAGLDLTALAGGGA